jgi:hypothetical protein
MNREEVIFMNEVYLISSNFHTKFILAGKAKFTIKNTDTGNRYTYSVRMNEFGDGYFVSVFTGTRNCNWRHYSYIGMLRRYKDKWKFCTTKASFRKVKENDPGFSGFRWCWNKLINNDLPEKVSIYHEGQCGKCGKLLTVPKSIELGIGPVCDKLINYSK